MHSLYGRCKLELVVANLISQKCAYLLKEDVRRQALNVFRMKLLGAQVISVEAGK